MTGVQTCALPIYILKLNNLKLACIVIILFHVAPVLIFLLLYIRTGEVIGPDGKIVNGPDGRPISLTPDTHSRYSLAPDGTILGTDHKPVTDNQVCMRV